MGNGFDKKAQKSEKRSDFYYRMFRWKRLKSLGQAFLKACRIQKDRVLCLQAKPRFMLFHGCKNVLVLVVPRSGTQKMIPKKEKLRKIGRGRGGALFRDGLRTHAGVSALASCKRKNHPEKSSGWKKRERWTWAGVPAVMIIAEPGGKKCRKVDGEN